MALIYISLIVGVIIGICHSHSTPEAKKAQAQRKYDKCLKCAEGIARRELAQIAPCEMANFNPYAYAVSLAERCGIRSDTATLAMESAGFSFGVSTVTQLKFLREYEQQRQM